MSSFRQNSSGACGDVSLTVPLAPCGAGGPPGAGPAEVRFAGVDTKEKMYEPKQRKKLVRVLTVVAYLFFVSLAAAMLSLYYVFLWNPSHSRSSAKQASLARQLSDEQLRLREQAARRELLNIQDQLRLNEQLRQQQEQQQQQQQQEQQRVALELRLQAWSSSPPPDGLGEGLDASPDYADFTESPDEDELYTVEPRMLRHHGLVVPVAAEQGGGRGGGADNAGNAIPLVAAASGQGAQGRGPGQASHPRPSRSGHAALRHASVHGQRGRRLDGLD